MHQSNYSVFLRKSPSRFYIENPNQSTRSRPGVIKNEYFMPDKSSVEFSVINVAR